MDITIDVEDYKLNVRAAAIIIHEGKVLVHKNVKTNYYALMGGRISIGEDSATTAIREVKEELGKEIELIGCASTIENFFEMKDSKYHEILFVYLAEFVNEDDKKITTTMKNIEGKDYLQYEWLDISKIDTYPLYPLVAKDIIKNKKFPIHVIHNELN
ncbi:MAG: NUDIX domain-containing protein [Clostridia bacterium]|nr:NUDIX domain-containing protein [Clostridia bacterium]